MSQENRPLILITNDDGIDSLGIRQLAESLSKLGEVKVVAPDRQMSAVSNAVTIQNPLRVKKYKLSNDITGYAVTGTPADCAKLGINAICERKPDLVVSGINHGQNNAINVLYSGTVGGAVEGMLADIPSMAISVGSHDVEFDCGTASEYALELAQKMLKISIPKGTLLNVNVPAVKKENIRGIKYTSQSKAIWKDSYEKRQDPFGREYYWFSGSYEQNMNETDTDDFALFNNYVSVTPIKMDFTDKDFLSKLSEELK